MPKNRLALLAGSIDDLGRNHNRNRTAVAEPLPDPARRRFDHYILEVAAEFDHHLDTLLWRQEESLHHR